MFALYANVHLHPSISVPNFPTNLVVIGEITPNLQSKINRQRQGQIGTKASCMQNSDIIAVFIISIFGYRSFALAFKEKSQLH